MTDGPYRQRGQSGFPPPEERAAGDYDYAPAENPAEAAADIQALRAAMDWAESEGGAYYKAEAAAEGLKPQSAAAEAAAAGAEARQEQAEAAAAEQASESSAAAAAENPAAARQARIGRNLRAALRRRAKADSPATAEELPPIAAIVPKADMQSFALIAVIAIMSFLAAWMLFAAHFIGRSAADWSGAIAREAVVQIMPEPGQNIAAAQKQAAEIAATFSGVARVRIVSAAETQALLAPWLGAQADIAALPVPRLVLLELEPGAGLDTAGLRAALAQNIKGARLDNQQAWAGQLARGAHIMQGAALAMLALVLAAMLLTVIFATRGACVSNAHIIEVLHFIGADDRFIARRFDAHFFRAGLKGGVLGGAAAAALFALLFLWLSAYRATPEGSQMSALFGRLSWDMLIFAEIIIMVIAIAVLTMATAHWTIMRRLYHMDEKSRGFLAGAD